MAPRYELDPVRFQLVDRNTLRRYWPALALAVLLFVGGVALVTLSYRNSLGGFLLPAQQLAGQDTSAKAFALLQRFGRTRPAFTPPWP